MPKKKDTKNKGAAAPRILELRKAGYLIDTVPDTWTSEYGINHKGVARYVLTQKAPIENGV